MQYLQTPPSPRFAESVKCFWSLEYPSAGTDEPEPVVPDGCVEVIFNLSDRFRRYHRSGEVEVQASSLIAGQMDKSVLLGPTGNVKLFGIRFKPAGAFQIFPTDMSELTDRIEPLDNIWGPSVTEIEERLRCCDGFHSRVAFAESVLSERKRSLGVADRWLNRAVDLISLTRGMLPIRLLAREIGISERGLERRFQRFVGVLPKSFSRIVRFQRVLNSLESAAEQDILETALTFGYFDQSHLINDFRQYSGMTPTAFGERSARMTEVFINSY